MSAINKTILAIIGELDAAVIDEMSGRVFIRGNDLTEELETLVQLTVKRCINVANNVNDDTDSGWDRGVRAAIREIKTEFGV